MPTVFSFPSPVLYVFAWGTFCVVVLALFKDFDDVAEDKTKRRAYEFLVTASKAQADSQEWPTQFEALFRHVFGSRHWSWKCVGRSILASTVAMVGMTLLITATTGGPRALVGGGMASVADQVVFILFVTVFVNIAADFASLWETRILLHRMTLSRRHWPIIVADVVLTAAVWHVGLLVLYLASVVYLGTLIRVGGSASSSSADDLLTVRSLAYYLTHPSANVVGFAVAVSFYTTFLTSAWLWLYLLAGALARTTRRGQVVLNFLTTRMRIEERPFRSIGYIAVFVVTAIFVAVPLVRLLGAFAWRAFRAVV